MSNNRDPLCEYGAAGGEREFQAEEIMRAKPLGRKSLICLSLERPVGPGCKF